MHEIIICGIYVRYKKKNKDICEELNRFCKTVNILSW